MSHEEKVRDLLLRATRDLEFREAFLKDPVRIAKENEVKLDDKHVAKIKETAIFIESLKDVVVDIPIPIYPLYPVFHRWKMEEFNRVLRYFIKPIYYPAPIERLRHEFRRFEPR